MSTTVVSAAETDSNPRSQDLMSGDQTNFLNDIQDHVTVGTCFSENAKMSIKNVSVFYGNKQAIFDASVDITENQVIAMIGPSGCGKSTFLR